MRYKASIFIIAFIEGLLVLANAHPGPKATEKDHQLQQQSYPNAVGAVSDANAALDVAQTATGSLPGGNAVSIAHTTVEHVAKDGGGLKTRDLSGGTDENEPDEDEPDENEPDENEPREKPHYEHDQADENNSNAEQAQP